MAEPLFGVIPNWLAGPLIIAGIMGGIGWLTAVHRCLRQQRRAQWRMTRAFRLYMQLVAKQSKHYHPEDDFDIQPILDILEDDDGKI